MFIWTTSLLGAYLGLRSVSLFAGGFPNEFDTASHIKQFKLNEIKFSAYIYTALFIALSYISIKYQYKQQAIENKKKELLKPLNEGKDLSKDFEV